MTKTIKVIARLYVTPLIGMAVDPFRAMVDLPTDTYGDGVSSEFKGESHTS